MDRRFRCTKNSVRSWFEVGRVAESALSRAGLMEGDLFVTIKNSAVFDAARETSIAEFPASVDTFRSTAKFAIRVPAHERISELGLDHFQVALVPLQSPEGSAARSFSRSGGARLLLVLPLTWKQLMEQVRKEIDRARTTVKEGLVRFGNVTIDLLSMEVRRSDRRVNLTAMEFKVLKFLVSNPNCVISRDDFLDQVWGYENYPRTRTVDNHILRLRQKLEVEFANPVHFRTVHGTGYKFTP